VNDTDIESLSPADAREYVLNFILSLKRTQKDRAVAEEEFEQWQRRVRLADSRDEPLLKKAAEARVEELKSRRGQLLEEEQRLRVKVDVLKEKLRALTARSSLQVDPQELLAQLTNLLGEAPRRPDDPAAQLQELEVQQALEELKRKAREGTP